MTSFAADTWIRSAEHGRRSATGYTASVTYGAAVMYDVGKVLYVGGGRSTNTAETIDLNASVPGWRWTGSMATARRHLNATVLPSGEVLVTGSVAGTEFNDLTQPARAAELGTQVPGSGRYSPAVR